MRKIGTTCESTREQRLIEYVVSDNYSTRVVHLPHTFRASAKNNFTFASMNLLLHTKDIGIIRKM